MELLYCAGDAKSLWLFWKGILFLHFLPLAGQRPLLGGGGGIRQILGNRCPGWVSHGVQRRGPVTPAFPAPHCKCGSLDVNLWRFLALSPSLACLFLGGLQQGLALGVVRIAPFAFPAGILGCELPVGLGGAGEGTLWAVKAFAGLVINRNLFTRITTAGHGALGPLVQLLGATDSSTGEPTERPPWTPSPRVLLLFWFLS